MASVPESGFRILNIILLDCRFNRNRVIDFQQEITTAFDLAVNAEKNEPATHFSVFVKSILKGLQGENTVFSVELNIVGVFEKFGNPPYSDDQFTSINGPAIIFPFIREHIASTALKAGIGAILLPPVNFTKNE